MLKWRTKLRTDFKENDTEKVGKDFKKGERSANGVKSEENGQQNDDAENQDDIENEIKEAVYNEKKMDKKYRSILVMF